MKKKLLSLLLSAALLASAAPAHAAGSAFPAVNTYPGYADVKEGDWFYANAKLCYEIGLMTGTDRGFEPNRVLTTGECVTLAARMKAALRGESIPAAGPGDAWWVPYNNYLFSGPNGGGINSGDDYAGRWQFLYMLDDALGADAAALLAPINHVEALPDPDYQNDAVALRYYNAGILSGVDEYGTFAGKKSLTRAEAAAMVSRIVRPELRLTFTLTSAPSQSQTGDMAAFVKDYLKDKAGATYFLYGDRAATAGDFLTAALTAADELNTLCAQQGVAFAWDNTLDLGSQGQTTFIAYVYTWANTSAIDSAGSVDPQTAYAAWLGQTYKAKHILITEEGGGKETADILYEVLKNDPAQFDPLLMLYGEDPGMDANPDGYLFGPGDMVSEFEAGTKALQPGQIGAPVQSDYGWHIIQRLPLTQADYENDGDRLLFSADFPDGIDVTAAYAAWLTYRT